MRNRARLTGHELSMLAIAAQKKVREHVSITDGVT